MLLGVACGHFGGKPLERLSLLHVTGVFPPIPEDAVLDKKADRPEKGSNSRQVPPTLHQFYVPDTGRVSQWASPAFIERRGEDRAVFIQTGHDVEAPQPATSRKPLPVPVVPRGMAMRYCRTDKKWDFHDKEAFKALVKQGYRFAWHKREGRNHLVLTLPKGLVNLPDDVRADLMYFFKLIRNGRKRWKQNRRKKVDKLRGVARDKARKLKKSYQDFWERASTEEHSAGIEKLLSRIKR